MQKIIIGREYSEVVTSLVKNSMQSIDILIYDWRWYDGQVGAKIQQFNQEIIRARARGVRVRAIVNNDFAIAPFQSQGIEIKKSNLKKTLHVKMLIFDSKYLVLGSHNLTKNAFEINHEISTLLDDEESIKKCQTFFDHVI
jgi:phosphatidylserine/phosphatidylglycerophosphate/cardiolipin synthase-like enzyme